MEYKDYKGYTKTYVVVYATGVGTMEDNFQEHKVVFETDDEDDAYLIADKFKKENNSKEEIESTWYRNRFHVNINTLSEKGKELLELFEQNFNDNLSQATKNGKYRRFTIDGITVYMDTSLEF